MALQDAFDRLTFNLDWQATFLRDFSSNKKGIGSASDFTLQDECFIEGLLSRVWQSWCKFCRSCVIESCMGTVNGQGKAIAALPHAFTEQHVSGAAIRANRKSAKPPYWGSPNALLRAEPTWGDVDVLANVLPKLKPTNSIELLSAFSSGYQSAKALQVIRNGAAHEHSQSFGEIQKLRSRYVVFPIGHPTHAMFWIDPSSKDFLALKAIDELREVGSAAISK